MPLLHDGQITDDNPWTLVGDDADLPSNLEQTIVTLQRFLTLSTNGDTFPGGVLVTPADDVLELTPYIAELDLIAIDFPVYTDGRGYSHARLLRNRLNYKRELRATGDVRADQILFMLRLGIDSFDFPNQPDMPLVNTLITRFKKNYQPSYALPAVG